MYSSPRVPSPENNFGNWIFTSRGLGDMDWSFSISPRHIRLFLSPMTTTLAEENEMKLKEKHADKFSNFQYKFWVEMLAHDQHQSFEDPPGHAMFRRESKCAKKGQDGTADGDVITGMLSIMNTLCGAITPAQSKQEVRRTTWSRH